MHYPEKISAPERLLASIQENDLLEQCGPLGAQHRTRRLAPFIGTFLLALSTMIIGTQGNRTGLLAVGLVFMLVAGLSLGLPWARLDRRVQGVFSLFPILLVECVIALDRGATPSFLPVMLLPLLWLTLYETNGYLLAGIALVCGCFGLDLWIMPSLDNVMRAIIFTSIIIVVLPIMRQLVATNRAALALMSEEANTDMLTGLANRRGLERRMSSFQPVSEDGVGIAFIDLNRFKEINDTYGHDAGDQLLVQIGRRIAGVARSEDIVARIGGDEFVVIGRGGRAEVAALAKRLTDTVAAKPFVIASGIAISASVSVGFSHMSSDTNDIGEFISEADHAMYRTKVADRQKKLRQNAKASLVDLSTIHPADPPAGPATP